MRLTSPTGSFLIGALAVMLGVACSDEETTDPPGPTPTGPTTTTTTTSSGMGGDGTGGSTTTATTSASGGGGTGGMATGGVGGMAVGGMGGMGGMSPGATGDAYFFGDMNNPPAEEVGLLDASGPNETIFTLMGLDGGDDIKSVAASHDGMWIAVSGNSMGGDPDVINLYAADGSGAPTTLYTAANADIDITWLSFSPDDAWIAFGSNEDDVGEFGDEPAIWVVPTAGGAAKRASPPGADNMFITGYAWSPNSTYVAAVGDVETNNDTELWITDITVATPAPVKAITATAGEVRSAPEWDSQNRCYVRSDHEGTVDRIYRVDADGSNLEQVPITSQTNGNGEAQVNAFGLSKDGLQIAFAAESPDAGLFQIYVADVDGNTAAQVSNVQTTAPGAGSSSPTFFLNLVWSPNGSHIAAQADWQTGGSADDEFGVFVVPTTGMGGVRVFPYPGATNLQVEAIAFSSDSSRLFVYGDLVTNGISELYQTADFTTADQSLSGASAVTLNGGGEVNGFAIVP